ncbi:elongator complex protein 2 [Condylostylus longicornis]|uniref:elongator complex protein 2 n=1 Tax=Condylostylus longicornis TaxID=2530218 RepID=UPI00244DBCD8|nr:elongator complex protein 2 [Condylostylus longicornis]
MKTENIYTSVACNRTPACLDWGNNGLVVYGACCGICLLNVEFQQSAKIVRTFVKHEKPVNCVKWIRRLNGEKVTNFVSGGSDGLAIMWDISDEITCNPIILKGHSNAVYLIDGIYKEKEIFIATASSDSTVRLWSIVSENADCFQILNLGKGICLGLVVSILPKYNKAILAKASDDNSISIWVETDIPEKSNFQKLHNLKGHDDWVRGLDFVITNENDLLLCSSSQDTFIRLWKISPRTDDEECSNKKKGNNEIEIEENLFSVSDNSYKNITVAISVESVLQGHEGWVYGVQWYKNSEGIIKLLSASMDKTLIIWEFDADIGVWTERFRLGEVGGNSLGFFGGKFSSDGKSIIGHSFQGGLHIWKQSEINESVWEPRITVSGHFQEVRDLSWEPGGEFFFSVSADQTTRIHAPFKRTDGECSSTWHEVARPQIHGYDMQTIATIGRYKFASGGEEKIIRMFQATVDFIKNFRSICKISTDQEGDEILESLPKGASVPSLGLSNKAVYIAEETSEERPLKDEYPENYYASVSLKAPPQEEILMQNTLWPEIHKLYGHGFEIYALSSSKNSKWLASSCRATSAEHAHILLWDTESGKHVQKLMSHQLTVTQLCFSPNNEYLLSVSRDRSWTLFRNFSNNGETNFMLEAKSEKSNGIHTRIIWSCDWSHDSKLFATSSRDGKVVLWIKGETESQNSLKKWKALECLEIPGQSITAVCFAPHYFKDNENEYLIAIGFESGNIRIYKFFDTFEHIRTIPKEEAHHLTVKKLQFSPKCGKMLLASCGEDNFVRIIELKC